MAGAYKRKSDKARGKAGKWTAWWIDEHGKHRAKVGFSDKARTIEMANRLEADCIAIREGLVTAAELAQRKAAAMPIATHLDDYRQHLLAKGDTAKHASHTAGAIRRLLDRAGVASIDTLTVDRVQLALGSMADARGKPSSARTRNHALNAVKAFAWWLEETNRVDRAPRGLASLSRFNEKADPRVTRRALGRLEIDRLLELTEHSEPIRLSRVGARYEERWMSGPDRAQLYRVAMATGFRAGEIRELTAGMFRLEGDEPAIDVPGKLTKNGKPVVQPITREMAAKLAPLVSGKSHGDRVLFVPQKTAKLLRHDLLRADIPYRDAFGDVVDFHALRVSYITNLIRAGVNPKIVQKLARHSSITLTMDVYTKLDDGDVRKALEGE